MATAIEYGLIAALIVVVVISAVSAIGPKTAAKPETAPPQCSFQGLSWPAVNFGGGWVCRLSDARWAP
jgi:hypothetical protein